MKSIWQVQFLSSYWEGEKSASCPCHSTPEVTMANAETAV
jgi:hypothetical protein